MIREYSEGASSTYSVNFLEFREEKNVRHVLNNYDRELQLPFCLELLHADLLFMKVLVIAPQPFFRSRGTPIRTRRQIEAISDAGHDVDVLCFPFGEDVDIPRTRLIRTRHWPWIHDIPIGASKGKLLMDVLLIGYVFWYCLFGGYDVIQAVEEGAFMAMVFRRSRHFHLIYNMDSHISDQLRFSGFLRSPRLLSWIQGIERLTMKRADWVVTVGSVLSDTVRRAAPGSNVLQLADAPAEAEYHQDAEGAARLREQIALPEGPCCVYTGNLEPYQGIDLLIRAAGVLQKKKREVNYVLAGGNDEQIALYRELAVKERVADRFFFTGPRPESDMPAFMTLADLLVSPRTQGTNPPMKMYSYMQTDRPLVATRISTHTQVLTDQTAVLTEATPEAFAVGIEKILDDPEYGRSIASAATDLANQEFSLASFKRRVREMYQQVEAARNAG